MLIRTTSNDPESITIRAPAKLNLFLEVLGRRTDGFHEVETSMVAVNWCDTLTFTEDATEDVRSNHVRLHCVRAQANGPPIPTGTDNLVVRAANLLRERTGVERGVRIGLVKRIPAEAGLGGGSSDAAATLLGLNRLWRLGLPRGELAELAAELGSDVPFFLSPTGAAICRGRGEIIEPIRLARSLHFVIAKPPGGCSTAAVFRTLEIPDRPLSIERHRDALLGHDLRGLDPSGRRLAEFARSLHNRLGLAAESVNEEVREVAARFASQPVSGDSMSGSGSAWFGLCRSARQARTVAARLEATRTGRVIACRSL